ncbi:MAG: NAD(P)(+) transhydrogenase (Re/Si-specific) subunit beta [Alphaproteobacteria bacterium]|nr:NAD(P)(+) transhydrogenase (Re/Si-specific) subunit beta [Alphaproteobacteria bacterium]MCB9696332.1 NAD(P)(+) transhydrogenase (Re/Si-specific) subunit beta [Alphaproteobacteria bacterium]
MTFDVSYLDLGYLLSATVFIFGLKNLSHPRTGPWGNQLGAIGMLLAVLTTLGIMQFSGEGVVGWGLVGGGLALGTAIGLVIAYRVQMTKMPEMVALLNGLGGAASALVALSEVMGRSAHHDMPQGFSLWVTWIAIGLSLLVGWTTLTGSLVAMGKLAEGITIGGKWIAFPTWGPPWTNYVKALLSIASVVLIVVATLDPTNMTWIWALSIVSCLLGIIVVLPIGGADMPVVVSLLNSLSGIAAAFTGFILNNSVLIVAGSLVGASGLILTFIMCDAMNRKLFDVIFKSFGGGGKQKVTRTKVGSDPDEVAMLLDGAQRVIIVPGYGMAVSQAQHAVREFADLLREKYQTEVLYAIHPVAGRMPGHMNVLLAEAGVPYEAMIEMDEVNPMFAQCDLALVLGANDTCNPGARSGEGPLAGMPIIDCDLAPVVVVVKRSLSVGYAGVDNDLFYLDKTMMLFGDGKDMMSALNQAIKGA